MTNTPEALTAQFKAESAAELTKTLHIMSIDSDSAPLAVIPDGFQLKDLSQHYPPRYNTNDYKFGKIESFTRYIEENKTSQTRLFINDKAAFAVIDSSVGEDVRRQAHKATLPLTFHEDFAIVLRKNKIWMPQEDFAEFCADIAHCIVEPDSATLLELAQELRGITKVTWRNGKRLKDGKFAIEYVETEELSKGGAKNNIEIPDSIKLSMPVFLFGSEMQYKAALYCEFRYRVSPAGIAFCIIVRGLEDVKRESLEQVVANLQKATTIKPFVLA